MNKNNYVAKTLTALLLLSISVINVYGQTNTDATSNQQASIEELVVKPFRLPALAEVGGSPFMTADYQPGSVTIAENKTVANVPIKFNIFNNAILIQKEGQELRLESFLTVTYDETGNDGAVKHIIFKQGYPEIDNNNDKSVYQVLAMGPKLQLLKFISQKIEDAPTLGDYSRREIVTTQQLYIYTPGGEIKKIKATKQSLVEALPALSGKIDELINTNKLNLKNEAGIIGLVEALNKP